MDNTPSFSYEPLWKTMKEKGVSTYKLINTYNFNKGTLYHLKRGDNVNVSTLALLCQILECRIEDVVEIKSQPPLQVVVWVGPHKGRLHARPKGRVSQALSLVRL